MMNRTTYALVLLAFFGCQERRPQPAKVGPRTDTNITAPARERNLLDEVLTHTPEDSIFKSRETYHANTTVAIGPSFKPSLFQAFQTKTSPPGESPHMASMLILVTNPSDSSDIMRIREDSIELWFGSLEGDDLSLQVFDLNYDGYHDMVISLGSEVSGGATHYYCYLYEPQTSSYLPGDHLFAEFSGQPIFINIDRKEITAGGRVGWIGYRFEYYRWQDGKYTLWARLNSDATEDGYYQVTTRQELINGEWRIVSADSSRIY